MHPFIHLSIGFWLYTALQCRSSMSSNCLVFHTSGGISSSPAAFLFLIFLRTESSSSCVNGPSLMSNCLLIILVIGSCVIFGGFPSRFSKCCFHSFILSCWFAAFSFALAAIFLLLTSFIVCQAILDYLSSTESVILSIRFWMYSSNMISPYRYPEFRCIKISEFWKSCQSSVSLGSVRSWRSESSVGCELSLCVCS